MPPMGPLLVLALTVLTVVGGQHCEPSTNYVCSPFVDVGTMIYIPENYTKRIIESLVNGNINLVNYHPIVEPCRSNILRYISNELLTLSEGTVIPVPVQPCETVCDQYVAACIGRVKVALGAGAYFPPGYGPPTNCSIGYVDSLAYNLSLFQTPNYTCTYEGVTDVIECGPPKPFYVPVPVICEEPLVASPQTGYCSFACPLPSLSDSDYDTVKYIQGILGWMSWVATAVLIIEMVVYPSTRDFPRNMIIMVACAANIAAGGIVLPTYAGYENIWCGGGAWVAPPAKLSGYSSFGSPVFTFTTAETTLSFSSPACTFQGSIIQFGILAAVIWWVLIALNMSLELYIGHHWSLEKTKWKWARFAVFLCIGWGLPFILMVIPAAAGKIKFVPEGTYCFITGEDNNAWSLAFWFLPVGISLLLGVALFFLALCKITYLFVTLRKYKKLLMLYLRLFLFICLFLILFVFIFSYTINFANNESAIDQGYNTYYTCLIEGTGEDCSLDDSLTNDSLIFLKSFAISSLGILLFFLFLSWDVSRFWFNLARSVVYAIINRSPEEALIVARMLAYKSASSTMSSSRASRASRASMHTLPTYQVSTNADVEMEDRREEVFSKEETVETQSSTSSSN